MSHPVRHSMLCVSITFAIGSATSAAQQDSLEGAEAGSAVLRSLERQVTETPPSGGDVIELCIFHHRRGVANARLGRYAQAGADLREALRLNPPDRRARDDWCVRWRILNDLHNSLTAAGDLLGALELEKLRVQTFPQNLPHLAASRGQQELTLGMLANAEKSLLEARRALDEYRRDPANPRILAVGWQELIEKLAARLQEIRGNKVEGERFRRLSLQRAQEAVEIASRLPADNIWRSRLAADNLHSAIQGLAGNLGAQGRFGEAEFLARQHLAYVLSNHSPRTAAASSALRTLAGIRLQQGQLAQAEHWRRLALEALAGAEVAPHSEALAATRAELGSVLVAQGRWQDALVVFEERSKGLRSNAAQFKTLGDFHIDWAIALLRSGDAETALRQVRRIIDIHRRRPFADPVHVGQLRGYLGLVLGLQGKVDEAFAEYRQALPVLQAQAEEDASSESGGFLGLYRLRTIIEGYLDLLARCHAGACNITGIDPVAESFRMADVARGSVVQRAVTSSVARAGLPDAALLALARQEQTTTNRIQSLRRIMERLAAAVGDRRLDKIVADMQGDLVQLEVQRQAQRKELAARFPAYANLVNPQPAALNDVQKALGSDEAAVALYVSEDKTFIWTITQMHASLRVVARGRESIGRDVGDLRAGLEFDGDVPRPFAFAAAHALFRLLLAEDAAQWAGAKTLNIIPHGPLGQLPFGMLLTGSGDDAPVEAKPWLIRSVAIAQLPSATAFLALRRSAPARAPARPLVGFGDPVFGKELPPGGAPTRKLAVRNLSTPAQTDPTLELVARAQRDGAPIAARTFAAPGRSQAFALLPQLPDTADELREIAQALGADEATSIYLGARATEKNLKRQDLSGYRVVAFATHGLTPGEIPGLDQPALALSNPQATDDPDNDGFLTMEEVLALQLNADWVLLSACNTAGGDGQANEAVSGLGRAFFYAGARSLLVSNWPVETVSARMLTTAIFRQQAKDEAMSRAEALRRSMLELMTEKAYAHPVFWAPFSLVGDGRRR